MAKWQQIETAPKDFGREVLLFGDAERIWRGYYVGAWMLRDGEGVWLAFHSEEPAEPTHWMPLPDPPQ